MAQQRLLLGGRATIDASSALQNLVEMQKRVHAFISTSNNAANLSESNPKNSPGNGSLSNYGTSTSSNSDSEEKILKEEDTEDQGQIIIV